MLLFFIKKRRKKKSSVLPPSNLRTTINRQILVGIFVVIILMVFTVNTEHKQNVGSKGKNRPVLTTNVRNNSVTTQSNLQNKLISSSLNSKTQRTAILDKADNRNKLNCSDDFRRSHLMSLAFDSGRTGNQLFRFASLLAISKTVCFKAVRKPAYILYLDSIFDLQNVEIFEGNYSFEFIGEQGYATYDRRIYSKISPNVNWTLGGFRQSYRYFQNEAEFVRSSLRFKENILQDVKQFLSAKYFQNKPKVCIHIRRKDMARKRTFKDGRVSAGIDFIVSSITYMENFLKPDKFSLIVVSDDKPWCKENIKGGNVYISPFPDSGRDLYLLTQCDHNIVTSGSYSWWGAWLNETGLVIYNKMYPFPNSEYSIGFEGNDYYPSHWVGM